MEVLQKKELIDLRVANDKDFNFIKSTWLHGLRYGNSWFTIIPKEIYYAAYSKVVEYLMMSPKTMIKVACLKEDPEVILGYSVYNQDNSAAHWVYVKSAWRKIGIAKALVPVEVTTVTHLTNVGKEISKTKGFTFNPFLIK